MPADLCTICGTPLERGACPRGHPQREARAARRGRRRRRRKLALIVLPVALILAAGGYWALVWLPEQEAEELMVPSSADFDVALAALQSVVRAYPADGDLEALEEATGVLDAADPARRTLGEAQSRLEDRDPLTLPVISSRPPLSLALRARDRMAAFYPVALQLVADLEAASRYLTELAAILPTLDNLRATVNRPRTTAEALAAVAAARPIVQQLIADLRALTPPDELTASHSKLLATARGIRTAVNQLERNADTPPLVRATVEDIRSRIASFRSGAAAAPGEAREAGLGAQADDAARRAERIAEDLAALEAEGVEGLTVPQGLP